MHFGADYQVWKLPKIKWLVQIDYTQFKLCKAMQIQMYTGLQYIVTENYQIWFPSLKRAHHNTLYIQINRAMQHPPYDENMDKCYD